VRETSRGVLDDFCYWVDLLALLSASSVDLQVLGDFRHRISLQHGYRITASIV
jgi:hypothetical protein